METGLAGKVVLITGATRNHGRASALAFAQEGAHLLICTRNSSQLRTQDLGIARFGVKQANWYVILLWLIYRLSRSVKACADFTQKCLQAPCPFKVCLYFIDYRAVQFNH